MKIMITGSNGMLGKELKFFLSEKHTIIEVDRFSVDMLSLNKLCKFVKLSKPDVIINCAAFTDVDGCEFDKKRAFDSNSLIPKNLAIITSCLNIYLMHISSDYVFDGTKKQAYQEDDIPNPINTYGQSKLMGENFIMEFGKKFVIIRTQWMYGRYGNNFVFKMLKLFKEKKELYVVDDQFGNPTYTIDFCEALVQLMNNNFTGIYHITNSETVSWFQFAKEIQKISHMHYIKIHPCTSEQFNSPAKRPLYVPLKNHRWECENNLPLRSFRKNLEEFVNLS